MKKLVFIAVLFFVFLFAGYGKTTNELSPVDKTSRDSSAVVLNLTAIIDTTILNRIAGHTDSIVGHTEPSSFAKLTWNDWYALLIAVIALIVSLGAFHWTKKGARWQKVANENTKSLKQLEKGIQRGLLFDLLRHLYRNKVILCSIRWQLKDDFKVGRRPSEKHLLKLQIPLEEFPLDKFEISENTVSFDQLHVLKLMFRNYNTEIQVANEHFRQQNIPKEVRATDWTVIENRSGDLFKRIVSMIIDLELLNEDSDEEIKKNLIEIIERAIKETSAENEINDEYITTISQYIKDKSLNELDFNSNIPLQDIIINVIQKSKFQINTNVRLYEDEEEKNRKEIVEKLLPKEPKSDIKDRSAYRRVCVLLYNKISSGGDHVVYKNDKRRFVDYVAREEYKKEIEKEEKAKGFKREKNGTQFYDEVLNMELRLNYDMFVEAKTEWRLVPEECIMIIQEEVLEHKINKTIQK